MSFLTQISRLFGGSDGSSQIHADVSSPSPAANTVPNGVPTVSLGSSVAGEKEKRELLEQFALELQKKVTEVAHQNEELQKAKETMMTLLKNASDLEAALQKERDKTLAIMNSMGEGVMTIDDSLRVSFLNPTAQKLLSLAPTLGAGSLCQEIITLMYEPTGENKTQMLFDAMNKGITTAFTLAENFVLKSVSGVSFPVSLTLTPLPDNNGGVLLFRDRTPERLVKEKIENEVRIRTRELIEEQAKLTASINSLQRAYIMTDTKGEILLTNTVINTLLGVVREPWSLALVQQKLGEGIDLLTLYKECQQSKKPTTVSRIQFGSKFLRISLNPFFLPEEHTFLGILILLEDITEDVVLQRSRDEFFSIASHELRTPLTSIRGNISLIKQFYPQMLTDKNLSGMIEDIHTSSIRLIAIVNEFLNLSRLELGKITFKRELLDILPVVRACLKEIDHLAEEKHLELKLETQEIKQAFAFADRDRLQEVITNLLSNAIKYTEKGSVTVVVERQEKSIVVQVKDTGRGIPLKNQSLLFRKFQQATDNIITRDTKQSTGLGLYISKLLMQGMGGTISLDSSEENKGSIFQITLPVPD